MTETDFLPENYTKAIRRGKIICAAPSNIALVKYWGKHGLQLPKNPSVSFTLDKCKSITELVFEKKNPATGKFDFDIFLDGKKAENFRPKIEVFFERALPYLPFLKDYRFEVHTENTFPHASGIASSASGMAALAMGLVEMEKNLNAAFSESLSRKKASFLARLGSGSACRSIDGGLVVWGKHPEIETSGDLFGVPYPYETHPVFKDFQDTILLVDEGEKQVSSTAGHDLMRGHPFAEQRFEQASSNLERLVPVFKNGDLKTFMEIVENEALSLHAMMMSGKPGYILMKPNTLEIIEKIREFRKEKNTNTCFTLDAGANVHVLYPHSEKEKTRAFIENELAKYCQHGKFIEDEVGTGAKILSAEYHQ